MYVFVWLTFLFVTVFPSLSATLPDPPPPLLLFCDRSTFISRSISPGFHTLLFFCRHLSPSFFFINKSKARISVDSHSHKEKPTKSKIYALLAVCNCTYPGVCPLSFFLCTVHERCFFKPETSLRKSAQNTIAKVNLLKQRFLWANTGIHLSQGLTAVCFPLLLFCETKHFLQSLSFRGNSLVQFRGGEKYKLT